MKKMATNLVLILAGVGLLAGCGPKETHVLRLGTNAQFPPFESFRGAEGSEVVGFDIDIAHDIATTSGKKLKVVEMEFDQMLIALDKGDVDFVMAGLSVSPVRRELADFSAPYYKATQVAILLQGQPVPENMEALRGLRLAALVGSTGYALALEWTAQENVRAVAAPQAAAVDLMNSQVDVALLDEQTAIYLAANNPELMLVRLEFPEEFYCVAVRKGDTALMDVVNYTLGEISESGRYDHLVNRWLIYVPEEQ